MKKVIGIMVTLAVLLGTQFANAEEIRFSDIEWGQSLAETIAPYLAEYSDSLYIEYPESAGISVASTAEANDAKCNIYFVACSAISPTSDDRTENNCAYRLMVNTRENPLYVAEYSCSMTMYFLPDIVEGAIVQNVEASSLYMAKYNFFCKDEQRDEMFDNLLSNLDALYYNADKENVYSSFDLVISDALGGDHTKLKPIGYSWTMNGTGVKIVENDLSVEILYWTDKGLERIKEIVSLETNAGSSGLQAKQ